MIRNNPVLLPIPFLCLALTGCLNTSDPARESSDGVPAKSLERYLQERRESLAGREAPAPLAKAADEDYRYIGLLKGATCPAGSTEHWIYMDNDNDKYWYQSMYLSATLPDGTVQNKNQGDWSIHGLKGVFFDYSLARPTNTKLTFCKLAVSALPGAKHDYAVLSFDSECPGGGIPFGLTVDDEDMPYENNLNSASAGIWPNESHKGGLLLGRTVLNFCFVPANPQSTTAWWTNPKAGVFTGGEFRFGFANEMMGKFRMSAEAQACCYTTFHLENPYWNADNRWRAENMFFRNNAHITFTTSWKKP